MADRAEQQLLGYLLEALDDSERKQLEEQLSKDPQLEFQLIQLRRALSPLEPTRAEFAPPEGLARRTCCQVALLGEPGSVTRIDRALPSPLPRKSASELSPDDNLAPVQGSDWSWKDLAVAAAIVVAATLLLFPAIASSRFNANLEQCSNNLRMVGQALAQYSQQHGDYFPPVPREGRLAAAGMFAPVLTSTGYLESPRWLVCPASLLAENDEFRVPSVEELWAIQDPDEVARLRKLMGGSYGYCLGFIENGRYHSPRNLRRPFFPLMSDAPSDRLPGHQSLNHGGRGQNVLFEDFHVQFFTTPAPSDLRDDFFVNDSGLVAAGRHRDDSVIGSSAAAPVRFVRFGDR